MPFALFLVPGIPESDCSVEYELLPITVFVAIEVAEALELEVIWIAGGAK